MKFIVMTLGVVLATLTANAFASADCTAHPKSEWVSEERAQAYFKDRGYTINVFKVDGDCYEIYGRDAKGNKVEIYFDTKTLAIVKSEVED
jgi:hypothetical protein